jgi:cytochrome c553
MVRKILKWTGLAVGVFIGLIVIAMVVVWVAGGRVLAQRWDVPLTTISIPSDSAAVVEGRRLAATRGCTGCHSLDLSGGLIFDDPMMARISAPNLTQSLQRYDEEQVATMIRHGVWPDGSGSPAMPSSMYYNLSDSDLGFIMAFLKSVPPVESELPTSSFRLMGRLGLAMGEFNVEAAVIDHDADRIPPTMPDGSPSGRYLAYTACTECHGKDLEGGGFSNSPPLVIVRGYSLDEFARLMETGAPQDGRDLYLMDDVALSRFSNFSEEEIRALHSYLQTMEAASVGD